MVHTVFADDAGVFAVNAILVSPSGEGARLQRRLRPVAIDFVHPYVAVSLTKIGFCFVVDCIGKAELFAHDLGVGEIPAVVADGSPLVVMVDFDATLRMHLAIRKPET